MKPNELLEEWTTGDPGMRPERIQQVREDLQDATGISVPRRLSEIESWLPRMKPQITRKLREEVEDEQSDEQEEQ